MRDSGMKSPAAEQMIDFGTRWQGLLAEVVHTRGESESPDLEDDSRHFLASIRRGFGNEWLGVAIREAGLSYEQGLEAIFRGEIDPFPDRR